MAKVRILLTALLLTLLLSLSGKLSAPDTAAANPDEVKWSRVDIPTEGETGDWVVYIATALLLTTVVWLITLLILVAGKGRS
ncbi:hypothetical protein ACFLT4_04860 [Chloroflexota bacterium]